MAPKIESKGSKDSFKLLQKPENWVLKIPSNYFESKISNPKDFFKLLQKQNKESPKFFQFTSKTTHKGFPRSYQFTSKTKQGIVEILSNYQNKKPKSSHTFY